MCYMASEIEKLEREFLEHLEIEKGAAASTILNYGHYLRRYLEFSKIKNAKEITTDSIREFRLWLNRQPSGVLAAKGRPVLVETLSKKTQNYYLIALRVFIK